MKLSKKIITLALAAVMTIGMSTTALASNESPSAYVPQENKATYASLNKYGKVTIAAGNGSIAEITDAAMQEEVLKRAEAVKADLEKNWKATYSYNGKTYDYTPGVLATFAFDVQGVKGGEVSVNLGLPDAVKKSFVEARKAGTYDFYAYVSHYNVEKKTWEAQWSKVTDDFNITFKFDSYSPILVVLTNVSKSADGSVELAKTATAYNAKPVQTEAKSPKTADAMMLVLVIAAGCAFALGTKKVVAR
ncbi:MAG: hypothetical protein K6E43_05595 [Lachnospiraceae bacterium]|nr:hypothetical protein [Lachnospiraceae bacterium]